MTTLARLSFEVKADQLDGFASVYERQIAPILKQHNLVPTPFQDRPLAAADSRPEGDVSDFSQLFAVASLDAMWAHGRALAADPAWQHALAQLNPLLCNGTPYRWSFYQTPAGAGKTRKAGPGKTLEAGPGNTLRIGSGFSRGAWHGLGPVDGVPSCKINASLQDRQGDLWFATELGLWRYDGVVLNQFTHADGLPHNHATHLLVDASGLLWIGTQGGASRYDGQTFTNFTTQDGLADNQVNSMAQDGSGHLWFCSGWDVEDSVGVSRFDGQTFTNFTTAEGLSSDWIISLLCDASGQLWLGADDSVSRFDGQIFTTTFTTDLNRTLGGVTSIIEDRMGALWFAVWGQGVWCYEGETTRHFTTQQGLMSNQAVCLLEDHAGQIWVGTRHGEIDRYRGRQLWTFGTESGLPFDIASIGPMCEDEKGRLWMGARQGMLCYEDGKFRELAALKGKNIYPIMADQQGHLWMGLWGEGLGRWDGQGLETFELYETKASDYTKPLLVDSSGRLWASRHRSSAIFIYDGETWTSFTEDIGLRHEKVWYMLEDRAGHLWFSSEGAGVSRYDGAHYTVFTTEDGLGHNTIGKMHQDRAGHLWFATLGGGLSRYDGEHFKTFTTADGLASNTIVDLGEDRAGHLLIATRGGVSRFDGLVFQSLSSRDGLAADSIAAVLEDRQGALWIATVGGLNRYSPTSHPPQVQLRDIIADRHYPPAGKIQIPSSQELVTFEFQGRSLTTPAEHMAYIYRLQGCDTDWQSVYRGQVEYQGLPEGDYTFQVKAVDRDLNYSEMAEIQLVIEPDALVESLTAALDQSSSTGEFVGNSPALQKVQAQLEQVAPADLTVLILGETGTGKGLAARILHQLSQRRDHPFIYVTCGAIPDALIESELFGHEKGSFTGASSRRLGKVELAKGGTLFLDEIGDMPLEAQIKLLQLLEERTFERVGGNEVLNADMRVVAATNRDLHQMVQAGSFRQDLYFRLQGFEIHLPLLRQRREDIPLLALYFIGPKAAHLDKEVTGLSKAAEQALVAHAWPGNVRELQHAIERAVVLCQGSTLQVTDLMLGQPTSTPSIQDGFATLQENERRHIQTVLESTRGRISGPKGAATILGIPESTLRTRMKKLGMK